MVLVCLPLVLRSKPRVLLCLGGGTLTSRRSGPVSGEAITFFLRPLKDVRPSWVSLRPVLDSYKSRKWVWVISLLKEEKGSPPPPLAHFSIQTSYKVTFTKRDAWPRHHLLVRRTGCLLFLRNLFLSFSKD